MAAAVFRPLASDETSSFCAFPRKQRAVMQRVLITDNLSPAGLTLLNEAEGIEVDVRAGLSPDEVRVALQDADGIIIRSGTKLTAEILEGQERLKVIVRAGVGVDNIDLDAATRAGIVVMNTPAGNTTSTAEHTIAMLMALSRNIAPAGASMKEGRWDRKAFTGTQLSGKTLGIIGLGRIGRAVARRARALEMQVIGCDPFLTADRAREDRIELLPSAAEVMQRCDYLTLHVPLNDDTRNLVNAESIGTMKRGVRIINCARGGIVNEADLAAAVESGHVAGAALDVFEQEPPSDPRLVSLPQVLATPHLGASTDEAQELVAIEAAEIISGFLLRNEIRFAVNMAPVSAAELQDLRIYLDLARRLGLLLAQWARNRQEGLKAATLEFRGEVADLNTQLMLDAFTAGLLETALERSVNIVNARTVARDRGIEVVSMTPSGKGDFSSVMTARIETESGELKAAGTVFGHRFLRLVRLGQFPLDAYLDGLLLVYRHRDVPGLIGYIGSICGEHNVNIAHMALGRERNEQGGDSVAVLNLDNEPAAEVLQRISEHPEVTGVELFRLPASGSPLPWLGGS